jgi:hypothetical protein
VYHRFLEAIMGKLFEYITDMIWGDRTQPKLTISLKKADASAEPDADDPEGKTRINWKLKLLFDNEMDAVAADLKIKWPGGEPIFDIKLPYHVDKFGDRAVAFKLDRSLPSSTVSPDEAPEKLWEHLPEELRDMSFVLSYRGPRGDMCYTKYTNKDGAESCEFPETLAEEPPRST